MSTATLSDIITKVRKLTGTSNSLQLTNSTIIDYINSFYLYDFPAEFRSLQLDDVYTFNTIENTSVYPFDFEHYDLLTAPAYVDKRIINVFFNPSLFHNVLYNEQYEETFDTGDGTTGDYAGTTLNFPLEKSYNNNPIAESQVFSTSQFALGVYPPSYNEPNIARVQNILISANTATGTVHVTDDGAGNLIGDCTTGTIDYDTGEIANLAFTTAIPSGNDIKIAYIPLNASRPQNLLFFQNQFVLSPTPDRGYQVEIKCSRRPSQVLLGSDDPDSPNTTGVPELLEWWETLAAGAAKKIFEDRQDVDGITMMDKLLVERYALNETRTYAQLGQERIGTMFSGQLYGGASSIPFYGNQNQ